MDDAFFSDSILVHRLFALSGAKRPPKAAAVLFWSTRFQDAHDDFNVRGDLHWKGA